jgi:hypothetical protein
MDFKQPIQDWSDKNKGFGLELPNGWFGRPYDNIHQITWIEDRKFKLLVEIDEQLLLIFTKTKQFEVSEIDNNLILKNYLRFTFDRLGYGDLTSKLEAFENGEVKLISYKGRN